MSNVFDLKTGKRVQAITDRQADPEYSEREVETFERIRDLIAEASEEYDQSFCDNVSDAYGDCFDESGVLDGFLSNYKESEAIAKICFNAAEKQEGAEAIREALGDDELLLELLLVHSEVEATNDIWTQWNEIGSIQFGEYDHQLDVDAGYHPELTTIIASMSDDDMSRYNVWIGHSYDRISRGHFSILGRPCERLILKLDAESFEEAVKAHLETKA